MINWLILFVYNTAYIQVVLAVAATNDEEVTFYNLKNVSQDLLKIGFPANFDLNFFQISVVLGFFMALILFFSKKYFTSIASIEEFLIRIVSLGFIFSGTFFTFIYILRIYYFPRFLFLSSIFVYPIITSVLYSLIYPDFFFKIKLNKTINSIFSVAIIICSIFLINNSREEEVNLEYKLPSTTTTIFSVGSVGGDFNCYEWSGSNNFIECIQGSEIKTVLKFDNVLNNLFVHDEFVYAVQGDGVIYKLDKNFEYEIFLDIKDKVGWIEGTETGLFSIAFEPENKYFLVNYSNNNNALIVEKYLLDERGLIIENTSNIILDIPNSITGHFGGNIYYSQYFKDFVIAIGDMQIQSNTNNLNHESIDTTTPRGKLLFLNSNISKPDLVSENFNTPPLDNILATGLRSPWQISEYDDYLFVTDVGNFNYEELNIVKLSDFDKNENKPFIFGWPIYEGIQPTGVEFQEVVLWSEDGQGYTSIFEYIDKNVTLPTVFYKHNTRDIYRAAIIGGDVLTKSNSSLDFSYVFIDFMSKEVFVYDLNNDALTIYALPEGYSSYPTSIRVNPYKKDSLMISSKDGTIIIFDFPK